MPPTLPRLPSVTLAVATALMLALLAAGNAIAESQRERCLRAAAEAIGLDIDPARYRVVTGTAGPDVFVATAGRDLICGFGGNDRLRRLPPLERGDIVIGGAGDDLVWRLLGGRFHGGPGDDKLYRLDGGTFVGGPGHDRMLIQVGGLFRGGRGNDRVGLDSDPSGVEGGTFVGGRGDDQADAVTGASSVFRGGPGNDRAGVDRRGTFIGGSGNDRSGLLRSGTFKGGDGSDLVEEQEGGRFLGGSGPDGVGRYVRGTHFSVESCVPADGSSCP